MELLQAWELPRWSLEPTVDALSLALVLVFLGCPHCALGMTSCKPEEYPVGDNCCPKCRSGYRVKEACRGSRNTLCTPCTQGTFTAHLNGLDECLQCRVCDPDMGLVTRQKCSSTANTVCGCAPGHFCVSHDTDQCAECRPHSVCRPGQRVQAAGTEHQDAVCEDCPPGTFSPNGTLAACQPWTQSVPLSVALASTVFRPQHQLYLHPLSPPSLSLSPVGCLCSPWLSCPFLPHPTPSPRSCRTNVESPTDLGSPQSHSLTGPPGHCLALCQPGRGRVLGRSGEHRAMEGPMSAAPCPRRSPPLGAATRSSFRRSLVPIARMPHAPPGHFGSSCRSFSSSAWRQLCSCS